MLSGCERHRKPEDLARPLHGDRADILRPPFIWRERHGDRGRESWCREMWGEAKEGALGGASAEVPTAL